MTVLLLIGLVVYHTMNLFMVQHSFVWIINDPIRTGLHSAHIIAINRDVLYVWVGTSIDEERVVENLTAFASWSTCEIEGESVRKQAYVVDKAID